MNIYFSENIKKLRKEHKFTQEKLAEYLGVSFQAVSKWERSEGYPDITMLPVISAFFSVTVDDLLGVHRAEHEAEITDLTEKYDNLCDAEQRKKMLAQLKNLAPNDYRVKLRELGYLVHFENSKENEKKLKSIYEEIQQNCKNDRIRISATRHIIIYYADLAKNNDSQISFVDVEKLIMDMPYMRDGQEFISSYLYPYGHKNYYSNIQEAVEESFCLLDTSVSHYYLYDDKFSTEYKINMLEKFAQIRHMLYEDGNYGEQWKSAIYSYWQLGRLYYETGDYNKAIENLTICLDMAEAFDSMERVTIMHSPLFEGRKFDKHKLGSTFNALKRMKHLITERYAFSEEFKNCEGFKKLLNVLNQDEL